VARPVTTGSLLRRGSFYAAWLPIGGLSLVGLGIGAAGRRRRRRWLLGAVLGLIAGMILLLPSCGTSSTATATPGGTAAGVYTINITGSAGNGASHSQEVRIQVD
jgi:ammonia channel protein AmtB